MKITIHPIAALPGHPDDTVEVDGDTITVNGVDYDLSAIPEGGEATAEGEHPFAGPIRREGGELHLGLIYHYSTSTAEPDQGDTPPVVEITSDDLPDPIARREIEEVEE